jgi:Zn-dependent peptidase ImmA (M78 family)
MDEERACHRFASAFIAPREAFLEAVKHERITPFDLYTLKHDWGLSMGACLYRCADLGLVSASAARSLWREFRQSGWMAQEPGTQLPRELPTRFLRAVYAAWCAERLDTELASALLLDAADDLAAVLEMDVDEPSR